MEKRLVLVAGLGLFLMGNAESCNPPAPTIPCDDVAVGLRQGSCTFLGNPCGDREWREVDGFRLCGDVPRGIYIAADRHRGALRLVCATDTASLASQAPVDFLYARDQETGTGRMLLTIVAAPSEDCSNAVDDDHDGSVDCADEDCTDDILCQEDCSNGVDDDLDGTVDCLDRDCTDANVCGAGSPCSPPDLRPVLCIEGRCPFPGQQCVSMDDHCECRGGF